jgi:hypothetical protein
MRDAEDLDRFMSHVMGTERLQSRTRNTNKTGQPNQFLTNDFEDESGTADLNVMNDQNSSSRGN